MEEDSLINPERLGEDATMVGERCTSTLPWEPGPHFRRVQNVM